MHRLTEKLIKRGVAKLKRCDVVTSGDKRRTQLLRVVANPIKLVEYSAPTERSHAKSDPERRLGHGITV